MRMLMDQHLLLTPGPTPVPDRVKYAMNAPMIGHRSKEFPLLLEDAAKQLMPVFGSKTPIAIIAGSGTAALEAAAANIIESEDSVIVIVTGAFGERFAQICEAFGANVHRLEIEWGKACAPEVLEQYIDRLGISLKAVFSTYCETSTGVLNPIQALGSVVKTKTDALFIVDGVSCIGAVPVDMEGWHIDILVSGSQKALMLPPGLAFIAAGDAARKQISKTKSSRFYLDLNRYFSSYETEHSTPFTPAVSLIFGAREVCRMIQEEGFENVINRHLLLKNMMREGLKALEIPLLAEDDSASPTITSIKTMDDTTRQLKSFLENHYSISLAGGQKRLKGQIMRIGHMGYCTPHQILTALSSIEMALYKISGKDLLGKGVAKAQEVWIHA
ncbi:pyridoxal-phosphate-dependent aminotransferase family protein [Falsibacillus pallidus]|uniref:pyridoxal-phosphate-dependent aminotransferase family protein n=1 Tax=Falsibacillus pallidus TaxID=493781 RepID=UPI003D95CF73